MKFAALALMLAVPVATPAFAAGPGKFAEGDTWLVFKESEGNVCLALFQYESGDELLIGYNMAKEKTVIFAFSPSFNFAVDQIIDTSLTVGNVSRDMKAESVQGPKSVGLFIDSPGQALLEKVEQADELAIGLSATDGEGAEFPGLSGAAVAAVRRCASGADPEIVLTEAEQNVLWNDLVAGMTSGEFAAKYPKKTTEILPGCQARVEGEFAGGRLAQVNLSAAKSDPAARCGEVIEATLKSKYGTPQTTKSSVNGTCGLLDGLRIDRLGEACRRQYGTYYAQSFQSAWTSNGLSVTLQRVEVCPCNEAPDPSSWSITYRRELTADVGAAAKL